MRRAAEFARRFDQGVEHGLQIERRAADDLQHLGGRGLLLQRFREVARARLHLSNSRAFSIAITAWSAKVCNKFDLASRERAGFERAITSTPTTASSRFSGTASIERLRPKPASRVAPIAG